MKLYHDIPKSKGVENALKRAHQMLDVTWVPVDRFPSGVSSAEPAGTPRARHDFNYAPWKPRKGMVYSSSRREEKYVGYNISLETFMTALDNPQSVLYTRSYHGDPEIPNMLSYYGIVCSCFGSYTCGFPYRTSGGAIIKDPDVTAVDYSRLENLELCDLVIRNSSKKGGDHVAVITDIQRDVNGNVHVITVSESVLPLCVSVDYTPEQFRKYWLDGEYRIYRYARVHEQTYEPSPYVYVEGDPDLEKPPVNTAFMSIFGNKANTRMDETVEFTVFEEKWETVEVTLPDGAVQQLPIENGAAAYQPTCAGYHVAVCRKGEETSQAVHFCVTDSTVSVSADSVVSGGRLEFTFRNAAGDKPQLFLINRVQACTERKRRWFTEEEIAAGKFTVDMDLIPGEYYLYTVCRNEYGFYASSRCPFTVE